MFVLTLIAITGWCLYFRESYIVKNLSEYLDREFHRDRPKQMPIEEPPEEDM